MDEVELLSQFQASSNILGLYSLNLHKLILNYGFGNNNEALEFAHLAENYLVGVTAQVVVTTFIFLSVFGAISLYSSMSNHYSVGMVSNN